MARNILVVEDDPNISDLIRMYLVKEGFDVRIAGDGGRAIEEFNKAGVDVSVFNADDDVTMDYYIAYASKMKAICTNYPKKLLSKMGK